jgi:hypothetical protein
MSKIVGFIILITAGGALVASDTSLSLVFVSLFAVWVTLNVLSSELISSGSPYAHLPLPRRRLHAAMLMPVLFPALLGVAIQVTLNLATGPHPGVVRVYKERLGKEPTYWLHVPPRYYEIAWDGQVPDNLDASGNPLAMPQRLRPDDPESPAVYSPYSVGSRAPFEFVVQQYTRAVKDIYGVNLDREQAEMLITRKRGSLESVDGLTLTGNPERAAISITIYSVIWMLLTIGFALFIRLVRPARLARWRRSLRARTLSGSAIAFIVIFLMARIPMRGTFFFSFFLPAASSDLVQLMPGPFFSLLLALLSLAAAWLVSQELFARRDVSPGKAEA